MFGGPENLKLEYSLFDYQKSVFKLFCMQKEQKTLFVSFLRKDRKYYCKKVAVARYLF